MLQFVVHDLRTGMDSVGVLWIMFWLRRDRCCPAAFDYRHELQCLMSFFGNITNFRKHRCRYVSPAMRQVSLKRTE